MTQHLIHPRIEQVIYCPNCGKDHFRVDHLAAALGTKWMSHKFGPWFCHQCGKGFMGEITSPTTVELEPVEGETLVETEVVLAIDTAAGPVLFVLRDTHTRSDDETDEELQESMDYLYNEHVCPDSLCHRVDKMIDQNGNEDPHGVFRFVSAKILPRVIP